MKIGDMATEIVLDSFVAGKWTRKEREPFKIVGEFETYFICRYPRASPFFVSKKKCINPSPAQGE